MDSLKTIPDLVAFAARRWGDRPALGIAASRETKKRLPRKTSSALSFPIGFRDLERLAGAAAGELALRGVRPGDRVALLCENRPEWIVAYLGIVWRAATAVPLDPLASAATLADQMSAAGAGRAVVSSPSRPLWEAASSVDAVRIPLDGEEAALIEALGTATQVSPAAVPSDTASILFTSGTSGRPRGVPLTHANFLAEALACRGLLPESWTRRSVVMLPLHHVLGFNLAVTFSLLSGTYGFFPEAARVDAIAAALRECRPTVLGVVPSLARFMAGGIERGLSRKGPLARGCVGAARHVRRLLRGAAGDAFARGALAALRSPLGGRLRVVISSGAAMDASTARFFLDLGVRIVEAYGLTETTGGVTITAPNRPRPGTAGGAVLGVELRIDAPAGSELGEILVRGPVVMSGYLSSESPAEGPRSEPFEQGWLRTGDLGRLEGDGTLIVAGRVKDLIVLSSGLKVVPESLEGAYAGVPYVREMAVAGTGHPGDPHGRELCGVIVPDRDALARDGILDAFGLIAFEVARKGAARRPHERLRRLRIVPGPLPRTTTMKLRRDLLAGMLEDSSWGLEIGSLKRQPARHALAGRIETKTRRRIDATGQTQDGLIASVIEEMTGVFPAPATSLTLDLGIDSLGRLELLSRIEKRLQIQLPESVLMAETLADLLRAVEGACKIAESSTNDPILLPLSRKDADLLARARRIAAWGRPLEVAAHVLLRGMTESLWGFAVEGKERLTHSGPMIFCPNHASDADVLLVPAALPPLVRRRCWTLGRRDLYETPGRARVFHLFRGLPIDNRGDFVPGLRMAARLLSEGNHILAFPEGRRSFGEGVGTFLPGAGLLALATGASLVPVAVSGTEEALPPGSRSVRFHRPDGRAVCILVRFGEPIGVAPMPEGNWQHRRCRAQGLMDRVRAEVLALLDRTKVSGAAERAS